MLNDMLSGAIAGLIATAPMAVVMEEALFRMLPPREQYPLPPSEITATWADTLGGRHDLGAQEHRGLTLTNHFGYGAATGALYGQISSALRANVSVAPTVTGIVWGLVVWSVSYLGLLPVLGILRPATQPPAGRNLLMIMAHVVWGSVLGILTDRWQRRSGRTMSEQRSEHGN